MITSKNHKKTMNYAEFKQYCSTLNATEFIYRSMDNRTLDTTLRFSMRCSAIAYKYMTNSVTLIREQLENIDTSLDMYDPHRKYIDSISISHIKSVIVDDSMPEQGIYVTFLCKTLEQSRTHTIVILI